MFKFKKRFAMWRERRGERRARLKKIDGDLRRWTKTPGATCDVWSPSDPPNLTDDIPEIEPLIVPVEDPPVIVQHQTALEALNIQQMPSHGAAQSPGRRGRTEIDTVVIHTSEGDPNSSYGPAHWFQDPRSKASAHYSVYATGVIYQSVPDSDVAWHAGNWTVNARSIGIEIQAQADYANWNDVQLEKVAQLVVALSVTYGIPLDRDHVIGHAEIPNQNHYDPGPHFPWVTFMDLIYKAAVDLIGV